jgi:hypothetical protein
MKPYANISISYSRNLVSTVNGITTTIVTYTYYVRDAQDSFIELEEEFTVQWYVEGGGHLSATPLNSSTSNNFQVEYTHSSAVDTYMEVELGFVAGVTLDGYASSSIYLSI